MKYNTLTLYLISQGTARHPTARGSSIVTRATGMARCTGRISWKSGGLARPTSQALTTLRGGTGRMWHILRFPTALGIVSLLNSVASLSAIHHHNPLIHAITLVHAHTHTFHGNITNCNQIQAISCCPTRCVADDAACGIQRRARVGG